MCRVKCVVCCVQYAVGSVQCEICSVQCVVYSVQCVVCSILHPAHMAIHLTISTHALHVLIPTDWSSDRLYLQHKTQPLPCSTLVCLTTAALL